MHLLDPPAWLSRYVTSGSIPAEILARSADIAAEIAAERRGWINYPLLNASGRGDDYSLQDNGSAPRATEHAAALPPIAALARRLRDEGVPLHCARVAVLFPRSVFQPHADLYESVRLLIPLTDHPAGECRYLSQSVRFSMVPGDAWRIIRRAVHGSANLSRTSPRVALLLDLTSGSDAPPWTAGGNGVPDDRRIVLPPWTDDRRAEWFDHIRGREQSANAATAIHEFALLPFLYEIEPQRAVEEMRRFRDTTRGASAEWDEAIAARESTLKLVGMEKDA